HRVKPVQITLIAAREPVGVNKAPKFWLDIWRWLRRDLNPISRRCKMTRYFTYAAGLILSMGLAVSSYANIPHSVERHRPLMSPDIKFIVDSLNQINPSLDLKVDPQALSQMGEDAVGVDLERLEEIILARANFTPKEIKTLGCTHVACGGGGNGCGPPLCKETNARPTRK
ncbi:MAG: hypothetical protein KDD43_03595, partial [Bdellovibrionales bacterium]|nr:hypothetical protein [Bdellovibrionales bacterium]